VRTLLEKHRLEMGHARALITLDPARATALALAAADGGWSVRELEERVRNEQAAKTAGKTRRQEESPAPTRTSLAWNRTCPRSSRPASASSTPATAAANWSSPTTASTNSTASSNAFVDRRPRFGERIDRVSQVLGAW
jgi:hypothetical protein